MLEWASCRLRLLVFPSPLTTQRLQFRLSHLANVAELCGCSDGLRTTSMRRPARVKPFSGSCECKADCRPTGGTSNLQSFLLRKVFSSAIDIADGGPTGGAQCCHPEFSNHRLALLPSALFVERLLRCQLGVLNWKRVLPSRTRTECLCFQRRRSSRVPQSPELGDLL